MFNKQKRRRKIQNSIRKKISGTTEKPRLSVYRSNKNIYVQLIDDVNGKTLALATSESIDNGTATERANQVGKAIADKAKGLNVDSVVFDRAGYLFHGRVKALADGAREAGLKF